MDEPSAVPVPLWKKTMQHQSLSVYTFLDKGLQMQMQLQAQLLLIHCFLNNTSPA